MPTYRIRLEDGREYDVMTSSPEAAQQAVQKKTGLAQGVKEDFVRRGKNVMAAQEKTIKGKQSTASLGLQTLGQGFGLLGDVATRGIGAAYKAVTPDLTEQGVKDFGIKILNSHVGQSALYAAMQGMEIYQGWKKKNQTAAANVEAAVNIASVLPAAKGLQGALRAGERGIKAAGHAVTAAGKSATQAGVRQVTNLSPLRAVSEIINPLPESVKKVLRATGTTLKEIEDSADEKLSKLNLYVMQGMEAAADNAAKTPLELAGDQAEGALRIMQDTLGKVGKAKEEALAGVAKQIVSIGNVRKSLYGRLKERTGIVVGKGGELLSAPGRVAKVTEASDMKAIQTALSLLKRLGDTPTARQVDDAVDAIQGILYKGSQPGTIPINTNVKALLKSTVGELNENLRSVGGAAYREANDTYSTVIGVRDNLNRALGREASKGGALMKRIFSPSDGGTKSMFGQVKEITGIDLVEEATFAKFVMDTIGDPRSASLLQQLGLISDVATGKVGRALQQSLKMIDDPIERARELIKKSRRSGVSGSVLAGGVIANEELKDNGIDIKTVFTVGALMISAYYLTKGKSAPSVLQIIDTNTGMKLYQTVKKSDFDEIKWLIDNGKPRFAGENIGGKVYHLTAGTPGKMRRMGFKSAGTASLKKIRRLATKYGGGAGR